MIADKEGRVIVIVAPSGAGKSTLIEKVRRDFPDLKWSVSYTTRPIRPGEVNGKHYNFISREDFLDRRKEGDFLEWAEVHSNYYGTSKSFVREKISMGVNVLLDLDVQGADALKAHFRDQSVVIFIAPPSEEELESRLRGRGTETTDVINLRLLNAKNELKKKNEYDYCVINDELEKAYSELSDIIARVVRGVN